MLILNMHGNNKLRICDCFYVSFLLSMYNVKNNVKEKKLVICLFTIILLAFENRLDTIMPSEALRLP